MDLSARRKAAHLLAYSLYQLFPDVKILETGTTTVGFFCDFSCKEKIEASHFSVIEEKMRQGAEVRAFEMVWDNARDFLRDHGAETLIPRLTKAQTVTLIQVNDFFDQSLGEMFEGEPAVSLWQLQKMGKNRYRIQGFAANSPETLRNFLKRWRLWEKEDLLALCRKLEILDFDGERLIWLRRGMVVRRELINLWREKTSVEEIHVMGPKAPSGENIGYFRERTHSSWNDETVFFDPPMQTVDVMILSNSCKSVISSLQMISETFNILNFELNYYLVSKRSKKLISRMEWEKALPIGKQIVAYAVDLLGREWPLSSLETLSDGRLQFSLYGCLERLLAFLLMQNRGWLPFSLSPEQVCVIPVIKQARDLAYEIESQLAGVRVVVDERTCPLKQKVSAAKMKKIPFLVMIGNRELETGCLAVTAFGKETRALTTQQLLKEVNEQLEN